MRQFIAVVHKDEDSAFGVSFPDLPGCFSAADDWADVIPQAMDALDLWFEDEPMVEPRALDQVQGEVAGEIADGAVLVVVPYIEADARVVRVNITMERGLLNAIDKVAKSKGVNRSAFLAAAARKEMTGR